MEVKGFEVEGVIKVDRLEFLGGATTENKTNTNTLEFADFQEVDNDEDIPF